MMMTTTTMMVVVVVELTDALVAVVEGDALVDVAPVGAGEVGLDAGAGDDVDAVLGVVERLEHSDERRPGVPFLVHAGAVVVQLDHPLLVRLRHLVHHPPEPLERPLLPRHPVEVGAPRLERRRRRRHRVVVAVAVLEVAVQLPHVVYDVLDDGDHRGGADPEADEEDDVVLLVVLRRCAVRPVDKHLGEAAVGKKIDFLKILLIKLNYYHIMILSLINFDKEIEMVRFCRRILHCCSARKKMGIFSPTFYISRMEIEHEQRICVCSLVTKKISLFFPTRQEIFHSCSTKRKTKSMEYMAWQKHPPFTLSSTKGRLPQHRKNSIYLLFHTHIIIIQLVATYLTY